MTDEDHNLDRELIAQLGRMASQAAAASERSEEIRQRVLAEYERAARPSLVRDGWRRTIHTGGRIMSHPVSRAVAAAAAVLVVAIWLATPRRSVAFGDFLAPIVDAKSARFKMTVKDDVRNQELSSRGYFLAPARIRGEYAEPEKMISIADWERGRMLTLLPDKKQAMIFEITGKPAAEKIKASNFFGNLREILAEYRQGDKKSQVEELGEKDLDGQRVFGFRLASTGYTQTLWGDPATGRLIRVDSTYMGPPRTDVVMSEFEFDVPLDEKLFNVEPPADYQSFTVPIDATPPSEEDFITSMRRLSDALDGQFPTSLDTPGIAIAFTKLLMAKGNDDKKDLSKEMMVEGVAIGRGLQFAMLLSPDADAHYAGKGIKRDGPKAPVFWYRVTGTDKFRVIYSDLSAAEVEAAPEVPGAIRMVEQLNKAKPTDKKD